MEAVRQRALSVRGAEKDPAERLGDLQRVEEAFGTDGYHHPALVSIDWRPFVGSHARSRWEGHTVLAFAVRDSTDRR